MKLMLNIVLPVVCIFIFSSCLRSSEKNNIKFVMIDYRYGFNNELNTFNDTFVKGVADSGSIKVKLRLSEAEQDEIIKKALAVNFFQMPDTLPEHKTGLSGINKNDIQFLRIKYKYFDKKIVWHGSLPYNNSSYKGLIELTALIKGALKSKPVYKALAGINSGYIQYYFGIIKLLFRG